MTTCSPRAHLERMGGKYPGVWKTFDQMRGSRGEPAIGQWPDWCYMPLNAAMTYAVNQGDRSASPDAAALGALAAWRLTQGIYRFDQTVYEYVIETPLSGEIPHQVLQQMPEWCLYVETPDGNYIGMKMLGFFAHLDFDINDGRAELRLVIDGEDGSLLPVMIHLGPWSLEEAVRKAHAVMIDRMKMSGVFGNYPEALITGLEAHTQSSLAPLISLLLYICSQSGEVGDGARRPSNPSPKRTKKGMRLFSAERVTEWGVGVRMGSALRRTIGTETSEQKPQGGGGHAGPRPHIRRAHWHGYWMGPRDKDRRFDLRWQPPIIVGVTDPEALPAVIRKVRATE